MQASEPEIPLIPDYMLIKRVGRGSYGDVWLARGVTGLFRAIKIVWKDRFSEASPFDREYFGVKRFAEISLLDSNQLAVLHIGRNDDISGGYFYYVMEIADDLETGSQINPDSYKPHTLREKLKLGNEIPVAECLNLGVNLAHALETLHGHGLVHRDVKPSNILLVNGVPKLADIGLVSDLKDGMTFVGTEGYIPPEGPGKPQADVFGLGKVLYELATGLSRKSFPKLPTTLPSRSDAKALLELNEILLKACDPDPNRRYQHAEELRQALLLVEAGKSVRRLYAAERGIRRAMRWLSVLGVIALLGFTGALVERKRAEASERLVEYAAGLTQVSGALSRDDYGSARRILGEISETTFDLKKQPIEYRILKQLAKGTPSVELRTEGPGILDVGVDANHNRYLIHNVKGELEIIDRSSKELIGIIPNVRSVAGLDLVGDHYLGVNSNAVFSKWNTTSPFTEETFSYCPENLYLIGHNSKKEVFAMELSETPRVVKTNHGKNLSIIDVLTGEHLSNHWEFFKGSVGSDSTIACFWVNRMGVVSRFLLSVRTKDGQNYYFETNEKPSIVGCDQNGPWWIMAQKGDEWRFSKERGFYKTTTFYPSNVRFKFRENEWLDVFAANNIIYIRKHDEFIRLKGHSSTISDIAIDEKNILLSGSLSGEIRLWNVENYINGSYRSHVQGINSNGHMIGLVICGEDSMSIPWENDSSAILDVTTLEVRKLIKGMRKPVSFESSRLIGIGDKGIVVFDTNSNEIVENFGDLPLSTMAWDAVRETAYGIDQISGGLISLSKGREAMIMESGSQNVFELLIDSHSQILWALSSDRYLKAFDCASHHLIWESYFEAIASSIFYRKKYNQLFLTSYSGFVVVIDAQNGQLIDQFQSGSSYPESIWIDELEDRIFVGDRNGVINIFRATDYQFLCSIRSEFERELYKLRVPPDRSFLASMGSDGLLQIIRMND